MNFPASHTARFAVLLATTFTVAASVIAQQPDGPQVSTPDPVATPPSAPAPRPAVLRPGSQQLSTGPINVPAGTRVAVILENGISTRSARAGDSIYFRTSFPITQNNRVVIPVGSYMRGSLTESKRPGRIKGRGEFRMRLETLILPNGYTVDLLAVPRSADSGGAETTDSEGKVTGPGGKGKDVGTAATTTVTGAGIGAIAGGAKGAGIGAGVGGLIGLGAILFTRGPEAQLPRGSTLDLVLERDLILDGSQIQYRNTGATGTIQVLPPREREQR